MQPTAVGAQIGALGAMVASQLAYQSPEARAMVGLDEMGAFVSDHIVGRRERGQRQAP